MMIRTNVVLMKFELMYSFGAILCVFSDFARPGFSFKLRHCLRNDFAWTQGRSYTPGNKGHGPGRGTLSIHLSMWNSHLVWGVVKG
jgi:hypothetical protein